jgi:hypothetical protein
MQIRATIWLFLLGLSAPAYALEHADASASMDWWDSEAERTAYQHTFLSGRPHSWVRLENRYPLEVSLDTPKNAVYRYDRSSRLFASGLRQRLLFTPQNAYVEAGIGIQNIEFSSNNYSNSMRFSLGGRIGFGKTLSLYGESAWMPGVIAPGKFDSVSGIEFETGLMLKPLPFLSIKAAYRRFKLNYSLTDGSQDDAILQGIVIGTGIRW